MKKLWGMFAMLLVAVTLSMTLTSGVSSVFASLTEDGETEISYVVGSKQHQLVQHQEAEVPAEMKICKDESGEPRACTDQDLLQHLLLAMGGMSGLKGLALAFFIAKLLLFLLVSPLLSKFAPSLDKGGWKLTIVVFMNLVVGVLTLMSPPQSLSFGIAVTHSSVLALASVFANQAYKQYLTSKGKA
jgi:hypothetical protein